MQIVETSSVATDIEDIRSEYCDPNTGECIEQDMGRNDPVRALELIAIKVRKMRAIVRNAEQVEKLLGGSWSGLTQSAAKHAIEDYVVSVG
jgi:hypothetical protein